MSRELDDRVAKALGYEVMGWEPSRPDPEAPTWYVWSWADEKHPVYLAHCICDIVDEWDEEEILSCGHYAGCLEVVPFYSTDIAAAWELVEMAAGRGWVVTVRQMRRGKAKVRIGLPFSAEASTAPEAICKAFLAWKEAQ